ncbi:MAG: methylated-DNA-[protein]-cysteine S-methyltransferase [Solirubrobacteraceae bacterium]
MHKTISTSIGQLTLFVDDDGAITRLGFGGIEADASDGGEGAALDHAAAQLNEYLAGERTTFDLPLRASGNAFEQLVWAELARIPYGQTASYGEIARRIGHPGAARAVGRANGRNPIAIVVPCHRVIGSDGSLTGYAGGLDLKRALLALEADAVAAATSASPVAVRR